MRFRDVELDFRVRDKVDEKLVITKNKAAEDDEEGAEEKKEDKEA